MFSRNAKSSPYKGASRVSEIARKNFSRLDSDDEDDLTPGDSYSIDPNISLWKTVDFGRSRNNTGSTGSKYNLKQHESEDIPLTGQLSSHALRKKNPNTPGSNNLGSNSETPETTRWW